MKTPVVWVTVSLSAAIVITATLVIVTSTRGDYSSFPHRQDGSNARFSPAPSPPARSGVER
jgi:hypothetical protein